MLENVRPEARIPLVLITAGLLTGGATGCRDAAQSPPPEATKPVEKAGEATRSPAAGRTTIRLSVKDMTPSHQRPVDMSGELGELAIRIASEAGHPLSEDGVPVQFQVSYGIESNGRNDPNAKGGLLVWQVDAGMQVVDDGLTETLSATVADRIPFFRQDTRAALTEVLGKSFKRALLDLEMQLRYRGADVTEARRGLASEFPGVRLAALRRLGELGDKDSVPRIVALLEGADDLTITVVIGVLIRLRDDRAVEPLAKLARGPNAARAMLVVEALAAIGTPNARKYLKMIGASNPARPVRMAAEEALAEPGD